MSIQELLEEVVQDEEGSDRAVELFEAETLNELEKYLSSSIFRRVGPVIAKRIVSAFGVGTVEVIEKSHGKLDDIRGIGKRRISSIMKGWTIQRKIKKACMLLVTPRPLN